jgi:hypothetical protein
MTGQRLQKLLFRLYINWAITLLILFIPKLIRHAKEHVAQAGEFAGQSEQQIEIADVMAQESVNYANPEWCGAKARQLEQEAPETAQRSALYGETPENYRNRDWCVQKAKTLQEHSDSTRAEAKRSERRAAQYVRWANALALLDILPFWAVGAILPWILHFVVATILRKASGNTVPTDSNDPDASCC